MDFSPKHVGETDTFTVDFGTLLLQGETIQSATWSCTAVIGVDVAAQGMISGDASLSGSKVSQLITGGLPNVQYAPLCTAVTSKGRTLILPDVDKGRLLVKA